MYTRPLGKNTLIVVLFPYVLGVVVFVAKYYIVASFDLFALIRKAK